MRGAHQRRGLQPTSSLRLVMSADIELLARLWTQCDPPACRAPEVAASLSSRATCSSRLQLSCRGPASARHRLTHQAHPSKTWLLNTAVLNTNLRSLSS